MKMQDYPCAKPRPGTRMNYNEHRYTSHDGLSLYCREYGRGEETIICLPGLSRNSKDFHDFANRQSGSYQVLCPDLRGRGQSDRDPNWRHYHPGNYAKDIWKLADELGIERFIIIGTSLGGLIAMIMAYQRAERLRAIVLNDIGPEVDPVGYARILGYAGKQAAVSNWQEAAAQCKETHESSMPDAPPEYWDTLARQTYRETTDGTPVIDTDPNISLAIRRSVGFGRVLTRLRKLGIMRQIAGMAIDPWDSFRAVSMPCLVLRGEISDILSAEIVDHMTAAKPDLVQATIPNRGHAPLLDEPESLAAIDGFLGSLDRFT